MEKRFFEECSGNVVEFYSNANQSLIDFYKFQGYWYSVKHQLESSGYFIIEFSLN